MKTVDRCNGSNLKTVRSRLGISQAEFASRLKVTRDTVARWELGTRRPLLSLEQIPLLLRVLSEADMTIDQVVEISDDLGFC